VKNFGRHSSPLQQVETKLEHARLVREDTLCRESMPAAERRWLASNRSPLARHWNLLTGLTVEQDNPGDVGHLASQTCRQAANSEGRIR
jgi:hypothetical protein